MKKYLPLAVLSTATLLFVSCSSQYSNREYGYEGDYQGQPTYGESNGSYQEQPYRRYQRDDQQNYQGQPYQRDGQPYQRDGQPYQRDGQPMRGGQPSGQPMQGQNQK